MKRIIITIVLSFSLLHGWSQQQQGDPSTISRLMQKHFDIVNETDTTKRNRIMKEAYAEDIYSVDPGSAVTGHAGMITAIEGLHKALPGALLTITGPVDTHHNVARFPYSLGRPGEKPVAKGWDIVVFEGSRITHIYTFVDK